MTNEEQYVYIADTCSQIEVSERWAVVRNVRWQQRSLVLREMLTSPEYAEMTREVDACERRYRQAVWKRLAWLKSRSVPRVARPVHVVGCECAMCGGSKS